MNLFRLGGAPRRKERGNSQAGEGFHGVATSISALKDSCSLVDFNKQCPRTLRTRRFDSNGWMVVEQLCFRSSSFYVDAFLVILLVYARWVYSHLPINSLLVSARARRVQLPRLDRAALLELGDTKVKCDCMKPDLG
jgi:hypothetical protein